MKSSLLIFWNVLYSIEQLSDVSERVLKHRNIGKCLAEDTGNMPEQSTSVVLKSNGLGWREERGGNVAWGLQSFR